jgi:hypothetical protein
VEFNPGHVKSKNIDFWCILILIFGIDQFFYIDFGIDFLDLDIVRCFFYLIRMFNMLYSIDAKLLSSIMLIVVIYLQDKIAVMPY